MIVFVTPLKNVRMAHSKEKLYALLERTVRSICAQTSDKFRAIVVCSDKPEISCKHPALEYLKVDLGIPQRIEAEQNADKAARILAGLKHASRYNPTHSMVVDADDCVSNRIAEYVSKHPEHPGWVLRSGFLLREGKRIAYKNVRNFNESCGSSVIVRYDLYRRLFSSNRHYAHDNAKIINTLGLTTLPFPGAVYNIQNGENFFMTTEMIRSHERARSRIVYYFKKALKYRPALVTRSFRDHYNLYRVAA